MKLKCWLSRDASNPTADEICYWDAPASELGFETPGSGAEPAEPAAAAASDEGHSDADAHQADAKGSDAADDVDADAADEDTDPLDLLTTREDEDEPAQGQRTIEDRYKSLKQRARKLERSLKKSLPTTSLLRESGIDARTLLASHQRLAALEAAADQNPRLRALLYGEEDGRDADTSRREPPARSGKRAEERPVPFDTNDEVGRYMHDYIAETRDAIAELREENRALREGTEKRVGRVESTLTATQRGAVISNWKSVTDAAAKELDKPLQPLFRDAMNAAMHDSLRGGHKMTPQQIVDHYLKGLRVSKSTKDRASAAAKNRIAERNDNLPRRPAQGSGAPASPQSRRVPRLDSFNRDISRRFGAA